MKFWNRIGVIYFDAAGDPGGGGPAAGSGEGGTPTGGNPGTSAPGAPAGGAPSGGAAAGQPHGQPAGFTYKEDRSTWVPSHKVREQTAAMRALTQELETERRRVAALSGVQPPPTGAEAENATIREQFLKVFPEMKDFLDRKDKLFKAAEFDFDGIQSQQKAGWEQRGTQALSRLDAGITEAYGGAELGPKALKHFQGMFISTLAADADLRARFEHGDSQAVVDEFVKEVTEGLLTPLKRTAAAGSADPRLEAARRLPRGGRGGPIAQPAARTVKPSDGESFHKSAFDRFLQG